MTLDIHIPDSLALHKHEIQAFKKFLQQMANRRSVGALRYGPTKASTRFMSRLEMELKAYKKSGNGEQLLNIAVYAFLESFAPENQKFHLNTGADSVTRSKRGFRVA